MTDRLRRFQFDHLPHHLQLVSVPYWQRAQQAIENYEGDPLLDDLLTKLWEAKNLDVLMAARPHDQES